MEEQKLTKGEKYLLKKREREQELSRKEGRGKIKKTVLISLPILLVAGGIAFGVANYQPKENANNNDIGASGAPQVEVSPEEYDAGTISMANGLVKYTYEINNTGEGDLKIDGIWTSCHCTTAILKVGEKTSPTFGMSGNPKRWSQTITPGQKGYLEVIFDPAFHGSEGKGFAARAVYLSTNDPAHKKAEVRLIANVVD